MIALARSCENHDMNDLVEPEVPVREWLHRLPRVSARLYEIAPCAWEKFEPARRQFTDSIAWLEWEGKLTQPSTTVAEALEIMERELPERARQWRTAAHLAFDTLGSSMLRELLRA